jgi:hypothetical protein
MEDVVKIISEGFALAKEAMRVKSDREIKEERERLVNPGAIDITSEDVSFTEDTSDVDITPMKAAV